MVTGEPKGSRGRTSDVPLDLAKEREAFVRSFLRKGVEYTEDLLKENTELRDELQATLRANARLRAQVASDDAIRDLLRTVERLELERADLLDRSTELEQAEQEGSKRQETIEQDLNNLANLYIATFQLHASASPRRVVRHLCDMMGQLVGAYGFVIYLIDEATRAAVPIASEGVEPSEVEPIPLGMGPVGEACLTGIRFVRDSDLHKTTDKPVAVLPMMVDGKPVGIIEIRTVLEQKNDWASLDHQLFELVAMQAGNALITANLYDSERGPLAALAGFAEKQKR